MGGGAGALAGFTGCHAPACTIGRRSINKVQSKDGTTITFDRLGEGPPVVLVCGGSTDRSANAPLAALLSEHFTILNYDRRGRGDSGDTAPYAVEREVDYLKVLIDEAGGSAFVYGTSSGGALALEAAASGLPITKDQEHNVAAETLAPVLEEFFAR